MPAKPPHRPVKVSEPAPAFAFSAAQLRLQIKRLGIEKVAAVLRVTMADLEPLLAGKVQVSRAGMRRLRETPC